MAAEAGVFETWCGINRIDATTGIVQNI